ncbi:methylamine utilization protein MauE [Kitasatospora sp. NBC_00240]|uniref:MauE/DoxX family redox-associated membrane protein n=1 Tax=Kitasatospora sp. NBC_00240 TaxID=2903567 RepID=UPI00225016AE|nr:MauE/DoxX family redox-associated membrane protein [Kitasatospora sp. NBC_00240]MCX5207774.1 methylamine utilization protein MauE [Kitasatospora sp. NBC_00240]
MEIVVRVGQGCLLLVFTLSVYGKVRGRRDFAEFTASVRALVPLFGRSRPPAASAPAVPVLAVSVVAAEATVVAALAVPGTAPAGFALAAALLAPFTLLALAAARRRSDTPCRCFGRSTTPLGAVHAVRNAGLLAVAAAGLAATVLSGPRPGGPPAATVTAWLAGGVLGLLATALDDLVGLFRPLPRKEQTP